MTEHNYKWVIVRAGKDVFWKKLEILEYGFEENPKSPYVLHKLEHWCRTFGSTNILLLENIPIKIRLFCDPI